MCLWCRFLPPLYAQWVHVCRCEGKPSKGSRGIQWGMGIQQRVGQVVSCCALTKSGESLQSLVEPSQTPAQKPANLMLGWTLNSRNTRNESFEDDACACVRVCVLGREIEKKRAFWLFIYFYRCYFYAPTTSMYSLKISLHYHWCILMKMQLFQKQSAFLKHFMVDGCIITAVFLALWCVSPCMMLCSPLSILVYFFSIFPQLGKEGHAACTLDSSTSGT